MNMQQLHLRILRQRDSQQEYPKLVTAVDEVKQHLLSQRPDPVVGKAPPPADWKDAHEAAANYFNIPKPKIVRK
nr:hypothetical protein 8 [Balneolaceae bacterium]